MVLRKFFDINLINFLDVQKINLALQLYKEFRTIYLVQKDFIFINLHI